MTLAYIMNPGNSYISIAIYEDGEYWTGAYKHDMTKARLATDEEVAADNAERNRQCAARDAYRASFGITNHGPSGPKKQPAQYAAMRAADKADPKAKDRFVAQFER